MSITDMNQPLRFIWYNVLVRFVVLVCIGINVRHRQRLPFKGPAIIVANHNSHLDTMVLMSLFSPRLLQHIRPVAASDYFLKNKYLAWFSTNVIGIVPLDRTPVRGVDIFSGIHDALSKGQILIMFPEGSRGEPEKMVRLKQGVARVVEANPHVPVVPVYLRGLGKSLPKGEAIFVPFVCDVFIGQAIAFAGDRRDFTEVMGEALQDLSDEAPPAEWS
ncbi:MAG: 1-acyl-sn-glycerol-3-phosphate acyltransferase [marine bacterium B5-7]|nr:MAG: 1-acyl-sn-glycerol-3-phosphate acyltransferase [marine bacterium B5-7]